MTASLDGTLGVTFPDSTTQATGAFYGGLGFRNRIINGAMVIDQRNAGASVTPAAGVYTVDRWKLGISQASKITFQQTPSTTETGYATRIAAGFTNYLAFTTASAAIIGSTDYFAAFQPVEGLNVSDLAWGTANAKAVTVSFLAYSSLTGTFSGSLQNSAGNRSYPFSYSIPTANTWTTINITIAGDTTGTWLTNNGIGIYLTFDLGSGSTVRGIANTWAAASYNGVTGAVSPAANAGATFYITGVQLEKGSTATSFDYRPYGTELALCQRYYFQYAANVLRLDFNGAGVNYQGGQIFTFPVTMRTTPSVNTPSFSYTNASGGSYSAVSVDGVRLYAIASAAGNCVCTVTTVATASAEL